MKTSTIVSSHVEDMLNTNTLDSSFVSYILARAVVVMIVWQLDLQLSEQSVHITTKVVSFNTGQ